MKKLASISRIHSKTLIILKNEISKPAAYICNLSFSSGLFPSLLKMVEIVPAHKKNSKVNYRNYRCISLLCKYWKN